MGLFRNFSGMLSSLLLIFNCRKKYSIILIQSIILWSHGTVVMVWDKLYCKYLKCILLLQNWWLPRILPNLYTNWKICPLEVVADQSYCFFQCRSTAETGIWLLSVIRHHDQSVTASKLIKLDFNCSDSAEMLLVWIVAQSLLYLWGVRATGKIVSLANTRAVLENKISLLRETRFRQLDSDMYNNSKYRSVLTKMIQTNSYFSFLVHIWLLYYQVMFL